MKNQKVDTKLGAAILAIIAITAGVFVWKVEKGQEQNEVQVPIVNVQKKEILQNVAPNDREKQNNNLSNWTLYKNDDLGFGFKYPQNYIVEEHSTTSTGEYFIKNNLDSIVHIKFIKWEGRVIKEGTPGTFWEKIAYSRWKYFLDNMKKIESGNCDEKTITYVQGPTTADLPKVCVVDKHDNYIKIETENNIIFYTSELEINWELNSKNSDLAKMIVTTLNLK